MDPADFWIGFGSLSTIGFLGWLFRPLVISLARRLEGRGMESTVLAEVDDLRAQLSEFEGMQQRVAELEDRLDFAERMLSGGKAEAPIEGGRR